jgi:hypothetical protein
MVGCAAIAALPIQPCFAQIGTGTFRWELSGDNGSTWVSNLEVPQTHQDVLLRAIVSWSADSGRWFASSFFDVTWTSTGVGGLSDAMSNWSVPSNPPVLINAAPTPYRFNNVLKLDAANDTSPPGAGPRWLIPQQPAPAMGLVTDQNPLVILQFTMALDGSAGERLASSVFADRGPNRFLTIYTTELGIGNRPTVSFSSARLIVVPTPASLALLAVAGVLHNRRRR